MPAERDQTLRWIHAPRMPLGDRYRGLCKARPDEPFEAQGDPCNCGYARGVCDRFPADFTADAIRFSVSSDHPLRVLYVVERAYVPIEHGIFEESSADEILAAQARAFLENHLRAR